MFTETKPKNENSLQFMKNTKNGMIVLMTESGESGFTGVCVRSDVGGHPVGYYSKAWITEFFEPIHGTLEL